MPFICYVHAADRRIPYMEILPEPSLTEAATHARRLMEERPNAQVAELYADDTPIARLRRSASAVNWEALSLGG